MEVRWKLSAIISSTRSLFAECYVSRAASMLKRKCSLKPKTFIYSKSTITSLPISHFMRGFIPGIRRMPPSRMPYGINYLAKVIKDARYMDVISHFDTYSICTPIFHEYRLNPIVIYVACLSHFYINVVRVLSKTHTYLFVSNNPVADTVCQQLIARP